MTGVKRTRGDLLTVFYSSGTETMAVPFVKGEDDETFIARREQVASLYVTRNEQRSIALGARN
eukprot:4677086-Prymnesium_polylepis.1